HRARILATRHGLRPLASGTPRAFTQRPGAHMSHPAPPPHPSGARAPQLDSAFIPRHVAVVMDGNGRWANDRGLPRTEGHKAGEASLLEVIHGAIEVGVEYLSAFAFST